MMAMARQVTVLELWLPVFLGQRKCPASKSLLASDTATITNSVFEQLSSK